MSQLGQVWVIVVLSILESGSWCLGGVPSGVLVQAWVLARFLAVGFGLVVGFGVFWILFVQAGGLSGVLSRSLTVSPTSWRWFFRYLVFVGSTGMLSQFSLSEVIPFITGEFILLSFIGP